MATESGRESARCEALARMALVAASLLGRERRRRCRGVDAGRGARRGRRAIDGAGP